MYAATYDGVLQHLSDLEFLSFTCDGWTVKNTGGAHFIVTVHGLSDNWEVGMASAMNCFDNLFIAAQERHFGNATACEHIARCRDIHKRAQHFVFQNKALGEDLWRDK